ncbi:MAG: hypothetical protein PVH62_04380 [Anaerolineae bacterium]|jgi:hypothetical protein
MNRIFTLKPKWALLVFIFLDTILVGMGMGVPILCILFGFFVGWYIVKITATAEICEAMGKILCYAAVTSGFTLVVMAVIWGRCIPMLSDSSADLANFGMPMILYEPRASFIGWLVLMIAISPFLQLLATIFGSYLTLLHSLWRREQTTEVLGKGT